MGKNSDVSDVIARSTRPPTHLIIRSSPKGEDFVGYCQYCKAEGLTYKNVGDHCPGLAKKVSRMAVVKEARKLKREQTKRRKEQRKRQEPEKLI